LRSVIGSRCGHAVRGELAFDEVALGSSWLGCDDGDAHGYFAVDRGDRYDGHNAFGLNDE